ncbi:MAG: hypothetical protein BWZ02_03275 [Lentisphaerae bacterium ADurb.BinA184]|nr:MAG: hypothetical protein BWZ02_03275 [Lentisphaerae bacterium ADurb.BinA184]
MPAPCLTSDRGVPPDDWMTEETVSESPAEGVFTVNTGLKLFPLEIVPVLPAAVLISEWPVAVVVPPNPNVPQLAP